MGAMDHDEPRMPLWMLLSFCAAAALAATCAAPKAAPPPPPVFIAHAGGIGNHQTYTNSLEALDRSVARGFQAIEIDLSWTLDDQLVLLHDWVRDVPVLFDRVPGRMSLEEFRSARSPSGLTLLTLDDLGPWLAENPEVLIVTDVKERNVEGLARLAEAYPQQLYRIVPQIYDPEELAAVRDLGFKDIVFTLYRSDLGDAAVVEFASANRLFGVTMAMQRALSTDLPARLAAVNVAVFVHTVNDHRTFQELRDRGVVGIYTDWLSPADIRMPTRPGLWTVDTSGVEPMGSRAIAFVPSKMDGLAISLVFSNGGTAPEPIRVTVMDASGNALGSAEIELQAGEERRLNAVDIFPPSVDHGWLRVEAADDVQATSRWVFRDNPETLRAVESTSCSGFVARGPGTGTSGLLVALVNPTNSMQAYVLRRRIGDGLVDEDIVELNPDHQLIRVYRSGTDEDIELQVTGGRMVPFTLRWDPLVRFID